MNDQLNTPALDAYNQLYVQTGANDTYRKVRWQVEAMILPHVRFGPQAEDVTTRVMNALTDAALEMLGYSAPQSGLMEIIYLLAEWDILKNEIYERVLKHLEKFSGHSSEAKEKLAEFKTAWHSVTLIQPIQAQLQALHAFLVDDESPQSVVNLRFVEAAQEMLKAVGELTRPNLCNVEFTTAKQNAMKAIKNIADGVDYIPEY